MVEMPTPDGGSISMPDVPVLPATVVALEVLLRERPIDLKAVSDWLLSDPGATLQLFRLQLEELDPEAELRFRIQDIVVELGADTILKGIRRFPVPGNESLLAVVRRHWDHIRSVAVCASALSYGFGRRDPERVYLMALIHGIRQFGEQVNPSQVAEPVCVSEGRFFEAGTRAAEQWASGPTTERIAEIIAVARELVSPQRIGDSGEAALHYC